MKKLYNSLFVSAQISLEDIEAIADAGIKTIINNRPDNEEPGQLTQQQASERAEALGINYVYLPMANGQPMPLSLVDDFKKVLDSTQDPVLAHCRSGMRSSIIWGLGQIASKSLSVDEVIEAAQGANIPLANFRHVLESATDSTT